MVTFDRPPEPYALLMPDADIQPLDIVWHPTFGWTSVIAPYADKQQQPHARALPPEGYEIFVPALEDAVSREWLFLDGPGFDWVSAGKRNADRAVDFSQVWARPKKAAPVSSVVPPRHRPLFHGEVLRRGDKGLSAQGWMEIPAQFLGEKTPASGPAVFCRPTVPDPQNWFVDLLEPGTGSDIKGAGTREAPFKTLVGACATVEAAYASVGRSPFGIVWDVRGVPLFAYDLPEPGLTEEKAVEVLLPAPKAIEKPSRAEPTMADMLARLAAIATTNPVLVASRLDKLLKELGG